MSYKIGECSRFFFSIIFIFVNAYSYGQYSILSDDYKKDLMKSINPNNSSPLSLPGTLRSAEKETVLDNKYVKSYTNYGNNLDHLLEITEPEYKLNPNLTVYNGTTPLNQLPAGSTQLLYMGGHFYFVSVAGLNVFPSGLDFGGGGQKKLSAKSKSILINVFGMEIEE